MPRHVFSQNDLVQFLPLLEKPLVQAVVAAARPIKRLDQKPQHVEDMGSLPVAVRGKGDPDGLPLEALQKLVRRDLDFVSGLAVRRGRVEILATRKPTPEERQRLKGIFSNRELLEEIRRQHKRNERPEQPPNEEPEIDPHLREVLLDENTPDERWIRAFRELAVARLIPRR